MKRLRPFALAIALSLVGGLVGTARAASPPLAASRYPANATITYRPTVSNHAMDCLWGFFCEGGVPLFHYRTQTDLNRVNGWAEFAGVHRNGHLLMAFELFASRYGAGKDDRDTPWAGAAFADLQDALQEHGYSPRGAVARLLPAGASGAQTVQMSDQNDMVVMAVWSGHTEIEATVAYYRASPSLRRAAMHSLVQQVRWAFTLMSR